MRPAGAAVRLACAVGWFALAASIAGCGDAAGPSPTPAPAHPSPSAGLSGAAREAANPDPNFDYGFTVQVAVTAFRPHWLVAACCSPVTWVNDTAQTVTVVLDHLATSSRPIPPGGTWVFVPKNVESVSYHLSGSPAITGVLQVNPTSEP